MGRLTGGHFELTERRKIGDYEHREFKAGFTYSFDEGDDGADEFLTNLQADLRDRVRAMVMNAQLAGGGKKDGPATEATDEPAQPPKAKRGRKPAAAKPAVDDDPTADVPVDDVPAEDDPSTDPVGEVDDPAADEPVVDFDEPEPPKATANEVTDAKLNEAVQAVNMKLKKPAAIRELIKKFGGPPLASVPQKQRAAFLKELKALK